MESGDTSSTAQDINGEVYRNICEMRTASEVLQESMYPSIKEACFECLASIGQPASIFCVSCLRGCHAECLEALSNAHYEIYRKLESTGFECLSCIDFNRCMQCKNHIDFEDQQVYSCSVCLRKTHRRCHSVPSEVMEAAGQRKFGSLKHCGSVCSTCLTRFGIKDVVENLTYNRKDYLMVLLDHPSPIHLTWIEDSQLNSTVKNKNILVNSEPEVQTVLSMHIPEDYAKLTLDKIWELLSQQTFLDKNAGMKNSFKFLTKWRHTHNILVWEDMNVFSQHKFHLSRFIHHLKMSDISTHFQLPLSILERYFANCIRAYSLYLKIQVNTKVILHDQNCAEKSRPAFLNESIDVDSIYQAYGKKNKQNLNINSTNLKGEAMCELIKAIYFLDKNPLPVAILTDESKVSWWTGFIIRKVPSLTLLALQGSHPHISKMAHTYLLKSQSKSLIFKFNILVVSYQSLKIISSLFDFRQVLKDFSLMIMDEKMSPLGRYFYDNVKTAKIKFHKATKEDGHSNTSDKNSSDYSSQKKSSLTLSSSHHLRLFIEKCNQEGQKIQPRSFVKILFDQFREGFYHNNIEFTGKLLNPFERLIFLRYVLCFGLITCNKEEIYNKMREIEPICFSEPKEISIGKLEAYINYFLVHIAKHTDSIAAEIKNYFFFTVDPHPILKTITDHLRFKDYCQLYQAGSQVSLGIPPPSITLEDVTLLKGWQNSFDYYICKGVLNYGAGNWEAISESRGDWKKNGQYLPFRVTLCQILGLKVIGLKYFSEFLRVRAKEIASGLQKRCA